MANKTNPLKLLLPLAVLMMCGCSRYYEPNDYIKAEAICKVNGGLLWAETGGLFYNREFKCTNGAKFYFHKIKESK